MRRFFLAALAFLTFAFPAVAQAKHPFTFEDMMKLKRVGEPEVSPDGKWVIFSVVDVDLAANTKTPHVWIVPTAGGQEKEIISDQDADRPRWAPEGKRFAFISTKEGGSQVWIADFDGSAGTVTSTHKLTSIVTEAGGELWSPDGKNILFTSDVYPECDGRPSDEQSCDENKLKEVEHSKVKAQIFTHLLYRHWNAYKEGKRTHFFVVSAMIETGTNAYDQLQRDSPRSHAWRLRCARVLARWAGRLRFLARREGDLLHLESRQESGCFHQQRSLDRPGQRRGGQKHHRRQSRQRLDAALFSRWPLHRLSRPAASGIRERPLSLDAVRPQEWQTNRPDPDRL